MANRLIEYLPPYWAENAEMLQILNTHEIELDKLTAGVNKIYTNGFILTADETRIKEWEEDLAIIPQGTLQDRRRYVLSKLRGQGKLNEFKIKAVVKAFVEGGECLCSIENSNLYVRVMPPNNGEIFRFPDIERTLKPSVPAHLGLMVKRYYSVWDNIKTEFVNWQDVKTNKDNWRAVYNHIERT